MSFGSKDKREQDLDDEIGSHLRMAERDRIERGETPEEARYAARREMGNVSLIKEVTRGMWGTNWIGNWLWHACFAAEPRIHFDRHIHPGPGHQRHHGHLQRGVRSVVAALALQPPGATGTDMGEREEWRGFEPGRSELPGFTRAEPLAAGAG